MKKFSFMSAVIALTFMNGCSCMNTKNESLVTTSSGLKIKTLIPASNQAPSPRKGQKVTVHYTGWLDNNGQQGTKFDSSRDRGTPFSFKLGAGQVIPGWDEGVALMKLGQKAVLYLPAQIAYGPRSIGGIIPANAALIFEVELLGIE